MKINRFLSTFFFSILLHNFYCNQTLAQKIKLQIISLDSTKLFEDCKIRPTLLVEDSARAFQKIKEIQNKCKANGYINFSIDSFSKNTDKFIFFVFGGKRYVTKIILDTTLVKILEKNEKHSLTVQKYLDIEFLEKKQIKIAEILQNKGYPFANVKFENTKIQNDTFYAEIKCNTGKLFYFDSLIVLGKTNINKRFLNKSLFFKSGTIFQQKKLEEVKKNLANRVYLNQINSPEFEFYNNKTNLVVYLNKRRANYYSGILGILPNKTNNKTNITGEFNIGLQNTFKIGEKILLEWKKYAENSQKLSLEITLPFIISNVGFTGNIFYNKQDSSYFNFKSEIGIQLISNNNFIFQSKYSYNYSTVLSTQKIDSIKDWTSKLYTISIQYYTLNSTMRPNKGINITTNISAGNKKNTSESFQIGSTSHLEMYIPIGKIFTLNLKNTTAYISGKKLYINELYKLGGMKSVLGFNDESLFASSYSIFTEEFNLNFEEYSSLKLFCQQGKMIENSISKYVKSNILSFGIGFSLFVKSGLFTLYYAVGKQNKNPIILRDAKIHFSINYSF